MQFYLNYSINELWKSAFQNEPKALKRIREESPNGNKYPDTIIDSYKWYNKLRQGQYEYIHEFRERINEINYYISLAIFISILIILYVLSTQRLNK
jgi:hypothetical protein